MNISIDREEAMKAVVSIREYMDDENPDSEMIDEAIDALKSDARMPATTARYVRYLLIEYYTGELINVLDQFATELSD